MQVAGGARFEINLNTEINGTLNLLANSVVDVQAGVTRVKKSVVAYGTTIVRSSLTFIDTAQTYPSILFY